jgi:hypothetical protein
MKYLSFSIKTILFFALTAAFLYACKKEFDAPPGPQDPDLKATHTIARLKSIHKTSGALDVIDTAAVISGVVIANDKSGNLYKQIYIQDATGAIQLMLDATGLYNSFPIGRRVFVKCKDLCVSDYGGMIQLGVKTTVASSPSVQAIASNLISQYIVGGSLNNKIDTTVITSLSQLIDNNMQDPLLGTLIRLNDFEFADISQTYSDTSAYKETVNLPIKNCDGATINVRTSGYSNFAGVRVPSGNGSLLAIYTVYMLTSRDKKQLILRDTSDVKFTGGRCSIFEENFDKTTTGSDIAITGWNNISEAGGIKYKSDNRGASSNYAAVTAFRAPGNPDVVTSWLITPAINITGSSANLNFQTKDGFSNGATLTVLISTDYSGSQIPSASTWNILASSSADPTLFCGPTTGSFTNPWKTGAINLNSYLGKKVYLAFRYDGANPVSGTQKTTTWQIDNVKITK